MRIAQTCNRHAHSNCDRNRDGEEKSKTLASQLQVRRFLSLYDAVPQGKCLLSHDDLEFSRTQLAVSIAERPVLNKVKGSA